MVDKPIVERAERVIALAKAAKLIKRGGDLEVVVNKVGKEIPQTAQFAHRLYEGELVHIDPYKEASRSILTCPSERQKIVGSLKEAIEKLD